MWSPGIESSRRFIAIGAGNGFLAVAIGAFGAHALRDKLPADMLEVFQTGAHYHLVHSVALVGIGLYSASRASRAAQWAGWLLTAGIVLFSGSLYALAVTGQRGFGAVTPFGGICFLAGWMSLLLASLAKPAAQ